VNTLELQDFALVGFSMGGGEVARYFGKFGSDGVRKAAILSGVPPFLLKTPDNPQGVDKQIFTQLEQSIKHDRYAFFTEFFRNFYNTDVLMGRNVTEQAVQASWQVAIAASPVATLQCVSTWYTDFRKDLDRVDVPTLVMHGDQDRIVPFNASGALTAKRIKGAKLAVIKGGPHNIAWTYPELVNTELVNFLKHQ
jgi:pimeloyl-ACP methyl ester carboxylesterase